MSLEIGYKTTVTYDLIKLILDLVKENFSVIISNFFH